MRTAWGVKRGPRVTPLAVILTGLALSLVAASPAAAARSEFFGISQSLGRLDNTDLQRMAARAGVQTERFQLQWASVQPTQGSFDWAETDAFVGALASRGIRPVPFVWGSPRWVADNFAKPPIDTAAHEQAWQDFLKAAVARYGPGGSYWGTPYHEQYGADATAWPITAWQVWNEPNLPKYFAPTPSVDQYARLLQISHDAIKSQDPQAQIVLAGLVAYATNTAWNFLGNLYQVAGVKSNFDVAALHPYPPDLNYFRNAIVQFRGVMKQYGDGGKQLWLTEVGWGSDPPDQFRINQGLAGQNNMLSASYKLILSKRSDWNLQRVFWFYWRDPPTRPPGSCSFCSSAGLLNYDGTAKPAYNTFRGFTAETTPPQASITSGPSQGGFTKHSTPSFSLASNEVGSTFECRVDADSFRTCSSPFTLPQLSNGAHAFFVKAIDAPGNESQVRSRSFTVDAITPGVTISSGPADGSTSSDGNPSFSFASNESGASLSCQLDSSGFAPCSSPYAASQLANGQHSFQVRATDEAGNVGSAARTWRIGLVIASGRASGSPTNDPTPSFAFSSPDSSTSVSCRIDSVVVDADCTSPFASSTLSDGNHTFTVEQGTDAASRNFTVDTVAPRVKITGPGWTTKARSTGAARATFTLKPSEHVQLRCRIDWRRFKDCSPHYRTPRLRDGRHRLKVKATDRAGNVATKRKRFNIVGGRKPLRGVSLTAAGAASNPRCHGVAATLIGSPHGDRLRGTKGPDVIVGFAGNDKIDGRGGDDLICARRGDDEVTGGPGDDRVLGGPGSDDIRGGAGRDIIRGGSDVDFCGGAPASRTFSCERALR
jgi:RTX calcium-binding nonapeptide repeat (4 copies)/Glycosyl hydrolase catalytic core